MKRMGIALVCALALATTACGTSSSSSADADPPPASQPTPSSNTDPRKGWVMVEEGDINDNEKPYIAKKCDGTTLLYWAAGYRKGGISAVPNSPECQAS